MSSAITFPFTLKGLFLRFYNALISPIRKKYFAGIAVQTDHDYMRSDRFHVRYEALGLDEAKLLFFDNPKEREYYFQQTRKEAPLIIRLAHLRDAILNRKPRPYEIG